MLIERDGPVIPHADNMVEEIRHPKYAASLFHFDKIATLGRRGSSFVDWIANLMIMHSLDQPKSSPGTHPCCAMICPHRLESDHQDPCLTELSIDTAVLSAIHTKVLKHLLSLSIEWLCHVTELG